MPRRLLAPDVDREPASAAAGRVSLMPSVLAADGVQLAYRTLGDRSPLLCVPGGPMQDAGYLGDLGGLAAHRRLVLVDPRGTGKSAVPADAGSYRCDRLVDDVERVREDLGLDSLDLLAHSAWANLAALYAERYPDRLRRLVLVAPSVFALGIEVPPKLGAWSPRDGKGRRGSQRRSQPSSR